MRFHNFLNETKKYRIIDWIKNKLNADKVKYGFYDDALGQYVWYTKDDTLIQIGIKETEDIVYLTSLSVKEKEDATKEKEKTGLGTKLVYLVKDYCDKTKKKMVVPESTSYALPYWQSIRFLERDYDVWMDVDGELYNTQNTFSYTP